MSASTIRLLVVLSLLASLFAVGGCGPGAEGEVAVLATETQAPSPTEPPAPTATPKPTGTPAPPTATSTPAPTATPEPPTPTASPAPTESVMGAQVYRDIDYAESGDPKRMLTIYTPSDVDPPYTTLLMLPGVKTASRLLEPLVQELIDLGYAVVAADIRQVRYDWFGDDEWAGTPGTVDTFCAYAWLAQNGADYGLDTERPVVFGHYTSGGHAATLGVADEEAYGLFMTDCPHPMPETGKIAGVAAYGGRFFTPEIGLIELGEAHSHYFSEFFDVPEEDWADRVDALNQVPPQEWRGGSALDEAAAQLAQYLPLYWVQGPEGAQPSPPFLLVHAGTLDPPALRYRVPESFDDSIVMAEKLKEMGVTVTSRYFTSSSFHAIVADGNRAIAKLATEIDAFIGSLSE